MPKGRGNAQLCYPYRKEAHRRGWLNPPAIVAVRSKGLSGPLFDSSGRLQNTVRASGALVMAKEMTGAEMVIEALVDQGVQHIFGYPGGAVLPIYDAMFKEDRIKHILVRHEQG